MMASDMEKIFSILDENQEGQIQLRRFVDVASNYYLDAEQLARITKALDPKNTGLINFEQFCAGISQISSLQGLTLKEVTSDLTRRSRENSLVDDSERGSLNQEGSIVTFNEYDIDGDEAFNHHHHHKSPSTVNIRTPISTNNLTDTKKSTPTNQNSNRNNHSFPSRLDSPLDGADEEFTDEADPPSNIYSPDTLYPRPSTQRISQSLKRTRYLQPPISTDESEEQLQDKVLELQKTLDTLAEEKQNNTERLSKFQGENTDLRSRLRALEERFQDLEIHQTQTAKSDQQKYTELFNHKDRTFVQEKEILQTSVMRINAIEAELKQTHTVNGQMSKAVKGLQQKLEDVDVQLNDSEVRCNHLADDNEKLLQQLRLQREELETEKLTNAQLAEQLTLESSRKTFGRTLSRTESIIKISETRIHDLDAQVRALKLENDKLKHENDELRERAVVAGIDEGRRLMANPDTPSYAAELEVLSKDELMSKLRDQISINDRLREYIERMLTVIIEHSPQLLEITTSSGVSIGSMGMSSLSSTNHRPSSSPSKGTESKSALSQSVISTESRKSDSSATSTTTIKEPADKYCRLS